MCKLELDDWLADLNPKIKNRLLNNAAEQCNAMSIRAKSNSNPGIHKVNPSLDESVVRMYILDVSLVNAGFEAVWDNGPSVMVKELYKQPFKLIIVFTL